MNPLSFMVQTPGDVFTTLYFIRNLIVGPISWSVYPCKICVMFSSKPGAFPGKASFSCSYLAPGFAQPTNIVLSLKKLLGAKTLTY
jgi:hypothetical protein